MGCCLWGRTESDTTGDKDECWFQAKKYIDLDLVERDFCSARQAYAHAQQEEVTEERGDIRVCNPATPREGREDKTELIDYPTITIKWVLSL